MVLARSWLPSRDSGYEGHATQRSPAGAVGRVGKNASVLVKISQNLLMQLPVCDYQCNSWVLFPITTLPHCSAAVRSKARCDSPALRPHTSASVGFYAQSPVKSTGKHLPALASQAGHAQARRITAMQYATRFSTSSSLKLRLVAHAPQPAHEHPWAAGTRPAVGQHPSNP